MKDFMDNKLISSFLNEQNNQELFNKYRELNSDLIKDQLDCRFRVFYKKYRLVSYLIKILHFESKHMDKKLRNHNNRYQLGTNDDETELLITNIRVENISLMEFSLNIQDHVENEDLYLKITQLTLKQQEILNLVFIMQMTDTEVAKYYGVSQQSISKTRRNIIKKLKLKEAI